MRRRTRLSMLALALLAFVIVAGCAGTSGDLASERALLPPLRNAWPKVEADIVRGVQDAVADDDLAPSAADDLLWSADRLESSLDFLDQARAIAPVEWPRLHPFAKRGVDDRVDDGELDLGPAGSFLERIKQFDAGIAKLQRGGS